MSSALQLRNRRRPRNNPLSGRGPMRTVGIALLWLFVAANVATLLWVILQAFRDTRSILNSPFGLPKGWSFSNFTEAWNGSGFGTATVNSVVVALTSAALVVVLAAPAAYFLSRHESRATSGLTLYFILGLGVPAQVIIIPLFVMLNKVYLTDSLVGLVLVYIGLAMPFTVFLLTAFFRSLPSDLEEAAALDGASPFATFVRIMLPVAKGGLVTAFVLNLIGSWNETLIALTLISDPTHNTLPLALIDFVSQQTYSGSNWGGLFAGLCIVILPMLIVYMWLGRKLSDGLTLGMGK